MVYAPGEKPGKELEEEKLQHASKQIVETAILQAVQQVSREDDHKEKTSCRRRSQEQPTNKKNANSEKCNEG